MPKAYLLFAPALVTCLFVVAGASGARAQGLDSCGNIHVEAEAQCEVVAPGVECEAQCTPISIEAACEARLVAECDGECNFTPPQNCSLDCQAECSGECTVDPGMFDCAARCEAGCSGECAGKCEAEANKAECMGACEGTCSAKCEGGCDVVPPEASCEGKCEASCDTQCEVEADLDCQIMCQSDAYAQCMLDVQGRCEADCETMEGALFCDGRYVDHGDNLQECVAAIEAVIEANVEFQAEGSSGCENGTCRAEGSASASCAALPGTSHKGAGVAAGLAFALFAIARRRRTGR